MFDPPTDGRPVCVNGCGRVANARHGLCGGCYLDPALRAKFKTHDPPKAVVCVHCGAGKVNRPRGLCWPCYYTPGVKELYPPTSKYAHRGVGNFTRNTPLPAVPTTAAPGTPGKVAALAHRAGLGVSLFHPADARYEGDPRPVEFVKTGVLPRDPDDGGALQRPAKRVRVACTCPNTCPSRRSPSAAPSRTRTAY